MRRGLSDAPMPTFQDLLIARGPDGGRWESEVMTRPTIQVTDSKPLRHQLNGFSLLRIARLDLLPPSSDEIERSDVGPLSH